MVAVGLQEYNLFNSSNFLFAPVVAVEIGVSSWLIEGQPSYPVVPVRLPLLESCRHNSIVDGFLSSSKNTLHACHLCRSSLCQQCPCGGGIVEIKSQRKVVWLVAC